MFFQLSGYVLMTKAKAVLPRGEDSKSKKPRLKKNEGSNATESEKAYIGQEVHGIVDGSFDAGYLLTVKVGDSPLVFRGLVFEPGLLAPLSNTNDIAPTIQATARDGQVAFPTSVEGPPVAEESSPAARASRGLTTSLDTKQEGNEGPSKLARITSIEQGRKEPSYVKRTIFEKESAGQGGSEALGSNRTEQIHVNQAAEQRKI